MLPRVLEPEVMDSLSEALDYDAMDHRQVNRVFVDDLLAALGFDADESSDDNEPDDDFGEILDLGTGTAQIPVELCSRRPELRVWGVDLAPSMLDVARNNIELACLNNSIMLDLIDAKELPYQEGRFAAVISNSIVHHIPEPLGTLREALRVAAPGGLLFFRDLLRPAGEAELKRLVDTYAAEANEHQRQMFADSLRAALSLDEIRQTVTELGGDPETVRASSDRHWTWSMRKV